MNANTTAYFTSHPETLTHNGQTYAPVPLLVGEIKLDASGELPQMSVDVSNFGGQAFRWAKDNDLSLNDVVIRMVNVSQTGSGAEDSIKMQIIGAVFTDEVGRFMLGKNFNYDAAGPRRIWERTSFPSIPYNSRKFGIL